jgi:cardiolipin synthase
MYAVMMHCVLLIATGCATLPDAQLLMLRNERAQVEVAGPRGPLSARRSANIIAELKRQSGELDILDAHIALEQALSDSPLTVGNKTILLKDGPATYKAMFAAIRDAKDHVNLETYIIEDDEIGRQFADLLLAKQAAGVQVNLIYDSVGSINTPRAFFERMQQGGINIAEFNPINPLNAKKGWQINNRDHRKLLIVDGRVAFIGGVNISNVYARGSSGGSSMSGSSMSGSAGGVGGAAQQGWRDTQLQLEGPSVTELQKLFIGVWEGQKGTPLAAREYFPQQTASGKEVVRTIAATPGDPLSPIYVTLISAIASAEKEVHLTNAYFVPDPQLIKALVEAVQRGVDVKLILPGQTDFQLALYAGRSHYEDLLEAGVKIYERRGPVLHAKTALIDGVWSFIGSTNLDWRSFLHNYEVIAVVLGRDFAGQMRQMFDADLAESNLIERDSWRKRPIRMRMKEWAARLWEHWL